VVNEEGETKQWLQEKNDKRTNNDIQSNSHVF